jgi:hypothetical protein
MNSVPVPARDREVQQIKVTEVTQVCSLTRAELDQKAAAERSQGNPQTPEN